MTKRIEVSASAFTELANALRVAGVGSKNGTLALGDVLIIRGTAPDNFNKFEIQILKAIASVYGVPVESLKRETELQGDSLDYVELLIAVEDTLGITDAIFEDYKDVAKHSVLTVHTVLNLAERYKCRP